LTVLPAGHQAVRTGYGEAFVRRSSHQAAEPRDRQPRRSAVTTARIQRAYARRGFGRAGITSETSPSSNVRAQVRAPFGDANASNAFPSARTDGNRAAGSRLVAR
jgi:hypothetical protein